MISKPLFSIITCTLNSEQSIARNINSVSNQTFKNHEHIFIDGNSRDKTLKIINKYKRQNPSSIKLFKAKPQGISHAMNLGILNAGGKYIIHLHSDDYFYDNKVLEDVNKYLIKSPDLDFKVQRAFYAPSYGKKKPTNCIRAYVPCATIKVGITIEF